MKMVKDDVNVLIEKVEKIRIENKKLFNVLDVLIKELNKKKQE
ncbi:MAG: hypothetical protein ACRCX8_19485 [Sarcina sp.]